MFFLVPQREYFVFLYPNGNIVFFCISEGIPCFFCTSEGIQYFCQYRRENTVFLLLFDEYLKKKHCISTSYKKRYNGLKKYYI